MARICTHANFQISSVVGLYSTCWLVGILTRAWNVKSGEFPDSHTGVFASRYVDSLRKLY